jgi:predicted HAD superfamily Cof-like phosphohydrolase
MEYNPQRDVRTMMELYQQEVNSTPTMPQDPAYRALRARLVLEEALEFVEAMGVSVTMEHGEEQFTIRSTKDLTLRPTLTPNLVKAADAVGDLLVVTYGGANAIGINAPVVFEEVHRSNMTKIWPDGTIHKDENGKVVKPDSYSPADISRVIGVS